MPLLLLFLGTRRMLIFLVIQYSLRCRERATPGCLSPHWLSLGFLLFLPLATTRLFDRRLVGRSLVGGWLVGRRLAGGSFILVFLLRVEFAFLFVRGFGSRTFGSFLRGPWHCNSLSLSRRPWCSLSYSRHMAPAGESDARYCTDSRETS